MKRISRKGLVNKLDTVFSKFIRYSYYDFKKKEVRCFTCGTVKKDIKDLHNGHFISRRHFSVRWDERNCRPQCCSCNTYNQGEQYKFSLRLGAELSAQIYKDSLKKVRQSDAELEYLIEYYTEQVSIFESLAR